MTEQNLSNPSSIETSAENGVDSYLSGVTVETAASSTAAVGQAAAPEPLVVVQPATGQTQEISLEAGQPVLLTMAAEETFIAVDGANFVLSFDGDGDGTIDSRVVFLNLVDQAGSENPPQFVIGGQVVSSGLLVTQTIALGGGNGEPIPFETAAGEVAIGGGSNVYDDNLGDAINLLFAQGVIPPTALVFGLPDPEPGEALDLTSDTLDAVTTVPPIEPPPPPPSSSLQASPDFEDVRPNRSGDANAPEISVTVDVLANDSDSDGDPLTLTSVELDNPALGSVTIVNNQVVFTPTVGVTETTVGFTYEVQDPDGNTASSTIQVTIGQDNSVQQVVADPNRTELLSEIAPNLNIDVDGPDGNSTDPASVDVTLYPNSDVTFTVTAGPETPEILDLYLLQDLTGSFRNDLPVVRGEQNDSSDPADLGLLDDLVSGVEAIAADVQFGLGSFRDSGTDGGDLVGQYNFAHHLNLEPGQGGQRLDGEPSANPPADPKTPPGIGATYDELFAGPEVLAPGEITGLGGDDPERQLFALNEIAINAARAEDGDNNTSSDFGFREGSAKIVVIITDATSKDWTGNAAFQQTLKANVLASGIVPIFLLGPGTESEAEINAFYDDVIATLGVGTRVPLAADSSDLVAAVEQGIIQIADDLTLSVSGDENDYVSIGAPTVDPDTGEHTWEVTLSAPLDEGHNNDPDIKLNVTNDTTTNQVGGEITVNVTTDAPESGGDDFDIVEGHNGQNVLIGGDGDDLLIGLGGDDMLTGGAGNDDFAFGARDLGGGVFDFDGNDIIQDFTVGEDQVNLEAMLDALGADASDVTVTVNGGNTEITVDGATDFMVTLTGITDTLTVGSDPTDDIVV